MTLFNRNTYIHVVNSWPAPSTKNLETPITNKSSIMILINKHNYCVLSFETWMNHYVIMCSAQDEVVIMCSAREGVVIMCSAHEGVVINNVQRGVITYVYDPLNRNTYIHVINSWPVPSTQILETHITNKSSIMIIINTNTIIVFFLWNICEIHHRRGSWFCEPLHMLKVHIVTHLIYTKYCYNHIKCSYTSNKALLYIKRGCTTTIWQCCYEWWMSNR